MNCLRCESLFAKDYLFHENDDFKRACDSCWYDIYYSNTEMPYKENEWKLN